MLYNQLKNKAYSSVIHHLENRWQSGNGLDCWNEKRQESIALPETNIAPKNGWLEY